MRRSVIILAVAAALAVIPAAYARPGGFGGPFHQPPYGGRGWGGWGRGGHSGFYFYGGFPLWWPYGYYGPPYYSGYYYDYPPAYSDSYNPPAYYYDGAYSYPAQDSRSWLVLGHDAGKDLRLQTVTWGWFIQYLRAYIINAPPGVQEDFRRGFIDGYGDSAEAALSAAMQQARPVPGPPPPPQPGNITPSAPSGSPSPAPAQQK